MKTEKITAFLVDDEKSARSALYKILLDFPEIMVKGEASNIPEAVREIHKLKPDLVFLDIEMPGYSGLQLLEFFNVEEITFDIVFVTAYNEYAIQAFKISAFDYLLKPVNKQEIEFMLLRYQQRKQKQQVADRMLLLQETMSQDTGFQKIAIPSTQGISFINLKEVVLLEASGAYTSIILENGNQLMASKPIGEFETLLEKNPSFFKPHRSFIINFNYVKSLQTKEGDQILMQNGALIPLSRYRKKEFEDFIRTMKI